MADVRDTPVCQVKHCLQCGAAFKAKPGRERNFRRQRYCRMQCFKDSLKAIPNEQRFWSKVEKSDGCWRWVGAIRRDGYGNFLGQGTRQQIPAHRFSYELHNGPIPKADGYHGWSVMHTCDNRWCVNPAHLRLGSHHENMLDAKSKMRHAHGERNKHARLTDDKVRLIRARRPRGADARAMAAELGVDVGTIQAVLAGRTWRHVE